MVPSSSCGRTDATAAQLVAALPCSGVAASPVGGRVVVHDEVELACVETVDALEVVAGLARLRDAGSPTEEHPIGTDQLDQLSQVVLQNGLK